MTKRYSIISLCLAHDITSKLLQNDIYYTDEIANLNSNQLNKVTGISLSNCEEIYTKLIPITLEDQSITLMQLLEKDEDTNYIVTFCSSLDQLLCGGIHLKAVTEICGSPGTGKTQLCLQLCISVQIPKTCGGVGGEAIIIDTEGSIITKRIKEIGDNAIKHIQSLYNNKETLNFTSQKILDGITYIRCKSYDEFSDSINNLEDILGKNQNVRLVVIDSLIFYLRNELPDSISRTSIVSLISQKLMSLATKFNIAVVVTNQMVTKINEDGTSDLVASLGDNWGYCLSQRLFLSWEKQDRVATLIKAPNRRKTSVCYQITREGIRDIPDQKESINTRKRVSESIDVI